MAAPSDQTVSPELQQFIARESQVAQIQSMIATLTDVSYALCGHVSVFYGSVPMAFICRCRFAGIHAFSRQGVTYQARSKAVLRTAHGALLRRRNSSSNGQPTRQIRALGFEHAVLDISRWPMRRRRHVCAHRLCPDVSVRVWSVPSAVGVLPLSRRWRRRGIAHYAHVPMIRP
jgi:hypothetical protein